MNLQAAIRSLLGIALTWVAISVASLWACATYEARTGAANDPFASLPLFFNRAPIGIAQLARAAMRDVSRGGPAAGRASAELARLGGAALPYVLPALDSLEPDGRVRVALALTPVAERMEVGSLDDFSSGDQAVLFWTRFWQDRAIDFRAPAVRHATARLAERAIALRREDLIHVDTFALPALIEALGEVRTPSDAARIERLNSVLAHVTNRASVLGPGSSVGEAAHAAEAWRDFWDLHGSEYSALDGPRRLTATFAETRYGKWLGGVLRGGLGRTRSGESAWSMIEHGLPATLFLLLVGLGGGFSLAAAWARFERRAITLGARYASAVLGTALAAVPCATFVRALAGANTSRAGYASAALIVMFTTAAWVSRHLSRSTLTADAASALGGAFLVSAPLGATYPPFVLSAIVLVELGFNLPGLGSRAARALASGDTNAWMAASLALALATLLLRELAELVRPRVTPRLAPEPP